jgi:NAD(P)-dependent dehydrogenase (short-subunit alcohol dehydrogenase family)
MLFDELMARQFFRRRNKNGRPAKQSRVDHRCSNGNRSSRRRALRTEWCTGRHRRQQRGAGRRSGAADHADGFEGEFVRTDVTDADSVKLCVDKAVSRFGKLDVIYNNAGGSSMRDNDVTRAEFDEFWRAIRLDLYGTWLVCHFGLPEIIKAGGGAVVNAASVVALMGWPGKDAYTAAKGGIVALTRSMAVEFAPHRVRVNAIAPGTTRTPRVVEQLKELETTQKLTAAHLLGMVEPIDVANAALFLASDASARTTGHILTVDSGLSIS